MPSFESLRIPLILADYATVAVTLLLAIGVALAIDWAGMKLLRRLALRTPAKADELVVERIAGPVRWILIAVALSFAQRGIELRPWAATLWQQLAGFVVPGLIGWLVIAIIQALADVTIIRNDITIADNLRARRRRTRVGILTRIAVFGVVFLTVCMMLLSIPSIRNVGVTLMASAGLAGLAVGAAAQPALKNLIAGIQMAFTEPIRLDDVIIMDGEWGRIEEIRLTYIVVRIWDDRRLIVPVSKFLEESFQNWTRSTAELMGSVFFRLDWSADIDRIRAKAGEIIAANPRWDQRFWNLQVTDMKEETMEVRVLVTARDASMAFDLRCDVREALIGFIACEMPGALPRRRQMPVPAENA
ncbi:mechanosensitive ion channel family protein [Sphingomonas montanisoli]|uniref:Mechanosensitive ion channel family protein n=1 Tax=Sphingomonas montanisoli TaxID=2606412 RepID=A0A5D9C1V3_9SPHN|nr:mechanosensitive ion channel family protein [Sphingomonas montanisoli]TZG25848.1 mechanosensitive ion channel family protein [Sphingomonas montanisoli]